MSDNSNRTDGRHHRQAAVGGGDGDGSSLLRVGLCQLAVNEDKQATLTHAATVIESAVLQRVRLVVLPECFNSPYDTKCFPAYAEELPSPERCGSNEDIARAYPAERSPTVDFLRQAAAQHGVYLVGGSVPELELGDDEGGQRKIYNTSLTFDPQGNLIAKHRKVHLFDIDVPGGIRFKESDVLSPGHSITTFTMDDSLNVGVGICYDVRFPEMAMLQARTPRDAKLLVYPGAFNMTTGPAHWELLLRARALDNQAWVCACSPARNDDASYTAWGHSMVVSPWGKVVREAGAREEVVVAELDLREVDRQRVHIPTRRQRRSDLYELNERATAAAASAAFSGSRE